jgi:hypothetical protein
MIAMCATYPAALPLAPLATAALNRSFNHGTLHNVLHTYETISFLNNRDHLNRRKLVLSEHQHSPLLPGTQPLVYGSFTVYTTVTTQATFPCSITTPINTFCMMSSTSKHLNAAIAATGRDRYLSTDRVLTSIKCAKQPLVFETTNTGQANARLGVTGMIISTPSDCQA